MPGADRAAPGSPSSSSEDLLRERGGRGRDRRGALGDRRLGAHLLAGVQRLAEEPVEQRPGRARLEGGAHLAEDLALAGDERVEPGGDAEEVERGRLVARAGRRPAQLVLGEPADLGERVERAALRVVADEVELGAVARREADRLAAVGELRGELARPLERRRTARSRTATGVRLV